MKAIIGMTIAPNGLFITSHSPNLQCCSSTLSGILYLVLKAIIPSGVSTSLENQPMCSYEVKIKQGDKKKYKKYKKKKKLSLRHGMGPKSLTSVGKRFPQTTASTKNYRE